MRKLFKFLAYIIGIVLLLLIAISLAVLFLFNSDNLKQQITERVSAATGYTAQIQGNINWAFLPLPSISIQNMVLANPAGFPAGSFVSIGDTTVSIKLEPLLQKKIVTNNIQLNNVNISLLTNKEGQHNWTAGNKIASTTDNSSDSDSFSLQMKALELSNANIIWQDQATQQKTKINIQKLKLDNIDLANLTFPLQGKFSLIKEGAKFSSQTKFETTLQLSKADKKIMLNNFQSISTLKGNNSAAKKTSVALNSNITLDTQKSLLNLDNLSASIDKMNTQGNLKVDFSQKSPVVDGTLKVTNFDLSKNLQLVQSSTTNSDLAKFNNINGQFDLHAANNSLQLNNISLSDDKTTLTGSLTVNKIDSAPAISFNVKMNQLALDNYLITKKSSAQSDQFSWSKKLNLKGNLQISKFTYQQYQMQNVNLTLQAKNGVIQFIPLTANMYQGNYRGKAKIDFNGQTPKISANEQLRQIRIKPLLSDLFGFNKVDGLGNINVNSTAQGTTKQQILRTLNGKMTVNITNGTFSGGGASNLLDSAYSQYKHSSYSSSGSSNSSFNSLTASIYFKNGVASNQDLRITSGMFKVTGSGQLNLVSGDINFKFNVTYNGPSIPKLSDWISKAGGSIPFTLKGNINDKNLKPQPDVSSILKNVAQGGLGKQLQDISSGSLDSLKSLDKVIPQSLDKQIKNILPGF